MQIICQFPLKYLIFPLILILLWRTSSILGIDQSSIIQTTHDLHDLLDKDCSLNGEYNPITSKCKCDPGWKGETCAFLSLGPAPPPLDPMRGISPGVSIPDIPTWGGGASFEDGKWHLLVGSLAINMHNNSLAGYPCSFPIGQEKRLAVQHVDELFLGHCAHWHRHLRLLGCVGH